METLEPGVVLDNGGKNGKDWGDVGGTRAYNLGGVSEAATGSVWGAGMAGGTCGKEALSWFLVTRVDRMSIR